MALPDFISDEDAAAMSGAQVSAPDFISDVDAERMFGGVQKSPAPLQSAGETFAGGIGNILDSLTFGFGDEIVAGGNSAIDALVGGPGYDARLDQARGTIGRFREENPVTSALGGVAGAFAMPIGSSVKLSDSILKSAAKLASEGAGYGAAYGFGSGQGGVSNRIENAIGGAESGALSGALIGTPLIAAAKVADRIASRAPAWADSLAFRALGGKPSDLTQSARRSDLSFVGSLEDETSTTVKRAMQQLRENGLLEKAKDPVQLYNQHSLDSRALGAELQNYLSQADEALGAAKVYPKAFPNAEKYIRENAPADEVKKLLGELDDYRNALREGNGTISYLQNQKEVLYEKAYPQGMKAREGLDMAMAKDLKTTIEKATDKLLPAEKAGAVRDVNRRLAPYEETRSIFKRELAKHEGANIFDKAIDFTKTTGGFGVPVLGGLYSGGPLGAAAGFGVGLGIQHLRSPRGQGQLASAIEKFADLQGALPEISNVPTGALGALLTGARATPEGLQPQEAQGLDRLGTQQTGSLQQQAQQSGSSSAAQLLSQTQRSKAPGESDLLSQGISQGVERQQVPSPNIISARALTQPNPASDATVRSFLRSESVNAPKLKERTVKLDDPAHSAVLNDLADAVTSQESGGNVKAVSDKGAQGLMQLMPDTGKELFRKYKSELPSDASPKEYNPLNAKQNRALGTRYLAELIDKYNGDLELALTAYHTGMGTVDKLLRQEEGSKLSDIIEYLGPVGQKYARQVLARLNAKKTVKPKMSEA